MIAASWDGDTLSGDVLVGASGITDDASLTTCVLLSLFSHRRARSDDVLPDGLDRRGWVGDVLAEKDGDLFGSRLWLLSREKQTEETRRRAIEYAREALAWMIVDKLADGIDISAEWIATGKLGMRVHIRLRGKKIFDGTYSVAVRGN